MPPDNAARGKASALSVPRRVAYSVVVLVAFFGLIELVAWAVSPSMVPSGPDGGLKVGHWPSAPYLVHSAADGGWVRARQELSTAAFVPDEVAENDLHVAFFGGSTMAALPPEGPAWQMGGLLDVATDGHVVLSNLGAVGFGTTRIRGLMDEVLVHEPDVVVLYTGHNEFMEARHCNQALDVRPGVVRRVRGWLDATGTWQLVQALLGGPPEHRRGPGSPSGPLEEGEEERLLERFRDNLTHMAQAATGRGAVVLWILPASNLSSPPLASRGPPDLALRDAALAGSPGAVAAYAASAPDVAEAWYLVGQDALKRRDRGQALTALRRARDLDQDVVRAKTVHRQILADVAAKAGIRTVDAEEALLSRAGERYLSGGLTFDAMHLTAEGYRVVAEVAYDALQQDIPALPRRSSILGRLPERGPVPVGDALWTPRGPPAPTDGMRVRHVGGGR